MIRWYVCAVAALMLVAAPAAEAAIIWQGGGSLPGTGTCPDGGISWSNDAQQGRVLRFKVNEKTGKNSERCEMAVAGGKLKNGMTVYIGWKSKVSVPSSNAWNGILQLKCHGQHVADQPLVLNVNGGKLTLTNHEDVNGQEKARTVWSTPLRENQWFSMLLKVHYSESRSAGSVQVWYNGQLQKLANGTTTHHGQTWDGSDNNVHFGIYRSDNVNGAQTHDVWRPRIATTMGEADPTA